MTPDQKTLADAVAKELGLKLAPGYDSNWARAYVLDDGGRLHVTAGRQAGHLNWSTCVAHNLREHRPYHRDGEGPKTSINVSDTKNAKQIAADIRRRLLPEYERDRDACIASKARHDEFNAKRVLALTKVAAPFGECVQCDERSGDPRQLSIDREGKFSLRAKPFCESIQLEIEVSPDLAGKIAALLAAL